MENLKNKVEMARLMQKMRDERYKLREIGDKFGYSRARVSQLLIWLKGVEKLVENKKVI